MQHANTHRRKQVKDKHIQLKVKVKYLAAEARIIRKEERKAADQGRSRLNSSLSDHRRGVVRNEARHSLLAYGFMRGKPYEKLETNPHTQPNWEKVINMAKRFGPIHDIGFETYEDFTQRKLEEDDRLKSWVKEAKAYEGKASYTQE